MATKVTLTFTAEEYADLKQVVADGVNYAEDFARRNEMQTFGP